MIRKKMHFSRNHCFGLYDDVYEYVNARNIIVDKNFNLTVINGVPTSRMGSSKLLEDELKKKNCLFVEHNV